MITVDASLVIAVLAGADPHHQAALSVIAAEHTAVIHTMTLAEVLLGGVRVDREQQMAARIVELGVVEQPVLADEARQLARLRAGTRLKLPDCCVLLTAGATRSRLATFDIRLARAARERGIEVLGAGF